MVGSAHPTEVSIAFAIRSFDRAYRVGLYEVELRPKKGWCAVRTLRKSLSHSLLGSLSHSLISRLISFDRSYRVGLYEVELSDQKRLVRSAHPTEVSIAFAIRSFDRTLQVLQGRNRVLRKKLGF